MGFIGRIENGPAADATSVWEIASPQDRGGDQRLAGGGDVADDELWKGETLLWAIDAAVARWQGWRIGRRTSRDAGIPHGLPYLTGLANHFAIMAEFSS